ncbi:hypothetical protein [Brevibacterium sp. UCMA 11752]|uniref:hypothetical protein n=1 Tax=Brevibacterium sp. UCMA 11752 TaxID=2745946 RepID=UPI001F38882F|nr:hypothetical protein [Brevibacterium sp. UCMA 11752]MCF2585820.1 hypothetical protein [Brevibacterium sp. UCMA 11752]
MSLLRRFTFAKQSDVVSAAWLAHFGGTFLDVDSLMITDGATTFLNTRQELDAFVYYGDSRTDGVHIGALSASKRSSVATLWLDGAIDKMQNWEDDRSWAYLGNSILEPLIKAPENDGLSRRIDVRQSLATPELLLEEEYPQLDRQGLYERFWFSPDNFRSYSVDWKECSGIVSLHNSWTPLSFLGLRGQGLEDADNRLCQLLREYGDRSAIKELEAKFYYGS